LIEKNVTYLNFALAVMKTYHCNAELHVRIYTPIHTEPRSLALL